LDYTGDTYDPSTFSSHPADYQAGSRVDDFYSRGEVVWRALEGDLTSYFGVNYSNSQTQNIDRDLGNSYYVGDRVKYDWRSVYNIAPGYTLVTGADHQNEQFDGPNVAAEEWNSGVYAQLQSE